MEYKTSLEMYRAEKFEIGMENLCGNSKSSSLLFDDRPGCLRTKSFLGKYTKNDGVCVVCGKETETIRRIVLQCECIQANQCHANIGLPEGLGFEGSTEGVNFKAVEVTERRLECWWKNREGILIKAATTCNGQNLF